MSGNRTPAAPCLTSAAQLVRVTADIVEILRMRPSYGILLYILVLRDTTSTSLRLRTVQLYLYAVVCLGAVCTSLFLYALYEY